MGLFLLSEWFYCNIFYSSRDGERQGWQITHGMQQSIDIKIRKKKHTLDCSNRVVSHIHIGNKWYVCRWKLWGFTSTCITSFRKFNIRKEIENFYEYKKFHVCFDMPYCLFKLYHWYQKNLIKYRWYKIICRYE